MHKNKSTFFFWNWFKNLLYLMHVNGRLTWRVFTLEEDHHFNFEIVSSTFVCFNLLLFLTVLKAHWWPSILNFILYIYLGHKSHSFFQLACFFFAFKYHIHKCFLAAIPYLHIKVTTFFLVKVNLIILAINVDSCLSLNLYVKIPRKVRTAR